MLLIVFFLGEKMKFMPLIILLGTFSISHASSGYYCKESDLDANIFYRTAGYACQKVFEIDENEKNKIFASTEACENVANEKADFNSIYEAPDRKSCFSSGGKLYYPDTRNCYREW